MISNMIQNSGASTYAPITSPISFGEQAAANSPFGLPPRDNGFDRFGKNDLKPFGYHSLENATRNLTITVDALNLSNSAVNVSNKNNANSRRTNSASTDDNSSNESLPKRGPVRPTLLPVASTVGGDDEKTTPDHHARRPMNAFLIFCKRHRGIVRERFPNLENRAITKILGDWWANLNESEKACYTNLAKQYKDAFLSANPDFKWYKLPAPPLRLATVRSNSECEIRNGSQHGENASPTSPKALNDFGQTDTGNRLQNENRNLFKLADETQMGGLNSLMMAAEMVNGKHINNNDKYHDNNMTSDLEVTAEEDNGSKDELHRVLGETHTYFQSAIKEFDENPYAFSFDTSNNNIPKKMYRKQLSSSGSDCKNYEFDSSFDDDGAEPKTLVKKSSRACKGKRYMEFMNAQNRMNPIGKKPKPRTTSSSSSASLSPTQTMQPSKIPSHSDYAQKMDFETFDHLYATHSPIIARANASPENVTDVHEANENPAPRENIEESTAPNNAFDASNFDLEQKIQALPAHNLDEYLSRKQTTKKKKKFEKRSAGNGGNYRKHKITKPKNKTKATAQSKSPSTDTLVPKSPKTVEEAKERLSMVGSQKRKARKESITRRNVQQITAIVQTISSTDDQYTTISKPIQINLPDPNAVRCGTSGLLMLATMAEVTAAGNYSI